MRVVTTAYLGEGVESEVRVSDDGFGLTANLYLRNDNAEVLLMVPLDDIEADQYFDMHQLANNLIVFADALREAAS